MSRRIKSVESRAYAKIIAFPRKKKREKKETNKQTNERTNEWMEKKKKEKRREKYRGSSTRRELGAHGNRGTTRRCVKPNIRIPDRIINHEFNQVYSVTRIRTRVADIISLIPRTDECTYVRFQIDPLITHLSCSIFYPPSFHRSIIVRQICYHANFTAFSHVYG